MRLCSDVFILFFTHGGDEFISGPKLKDISHVDKYGAGQRVSIHPLIISITNLENFIIDLFPVMHVMLIKGIVHN